MTDQSDEADIHLSEDEALVLFELLSTWLEPDGTTPTSDQAELAAMNAVLGQLERQLVAPFRADYAQRVNDARTRLTSR